MFWTEQAPYNYSFANGDSVLSYDWFSGICRVSDPATAWFEAHGITEYGFEENRLWFANEEDFLFFHMTFYRPQKLFTIDASRIVAGSISADKLVISGTRINGV